MSHTAFYLLFIPGFSILMLAVVAIVAMAALGARVEPPGDETGSSEAHR